MNSRCAIKAYVKPVLSLLLVLLFTACGEGANKSGTGYGVQSSGSEHLSDDENDEHSKNDKGENTIASIVAIHKPSSPQYSDKCLNCHGDILIQQSLDSTIKTAHVHMLQFTPGKDSKQCIWCHRDVSGNLVQTAAITGPFASNIRKTVDTQLCAICHGPVGPGKQFYQTGLTTDNDLNGAQLYHYLCSSCHRALTNSEVVGTSVREIYNEINKNEGGMGALAVLNPAWVQSIGAALGGDTSLPPDLPTAGTGDALYQQYCASCHGPLTSSAKAGASVAQIQNAINTAVQQMFPLQFLTTTQIQMIADALAGTGSGGSGGGSVDGAALYNANCSGCHGPLTNSDKAGASAALIQNGITNVTQMAGLSFLTTTQIQAISNALNGLGGGSGGGGTIPDDGASLYAVYCASCHNTLNKSSVRGTSASKISEAISKNEGGVMGTLSNLTREQIQLIADAVNGNGDSDD